MPAIRTDTVALRLDTGIVCSQTSVFHNEIIRDEFSLRERTVTQDTQTSPPSSLPAKSAKKKKSPNAFILFRSHAIANRMIPKDVTHQNEVSRMVGDLWHVQDRETRDHFFKRAREEKLRSQSEGYIHLDKKKRKRKPKVRTNAPTHRTTNLEDAKTSTVPVYQDVCPGTPALSIDSSVSNQSSQYSGPSSEKTSLQSPPDDLTPHELSYSLPASNLEHIESDFLQTAPELSALDFEWNATSPASSLSFTSLPTPEENALHLDFHIDTSSYDVVDYFWSFARASSMT